MRDSFLLCRRLRGFWTCYNSIKVTFHAARCSLFLKMSKSTVCQLVGMLFGGVLRVGLNYTVIYLVVSVCGVVDECCGNGDAAPVLSLGDTE